VSVLVHEDMDASRANRRLSASVLMRETRTAAAEKAIGVRVGEEWCATANSEYEAGMAKS